MINNMKKFVCVCLLLSVFLLTSCHVTVNKPYSGDYLEGYIGGMEDSLLVFNGSSYDVVLCDRFKYDQVMINRFVVMGVIGSCGIR